MTASVNVVRRRPFGRALIDSEVRYRRLFEAAQDGILILNATTGKITDVNPFLIELLHYSREEFLGKTLWDIGVFEDIEISKKTFQELKATKYVRYDDLPLRRKDGLSVNVEFVSNVYAVNKTKKVIQCNIRDISTRKRTQELEQQLLQAQKLETIGQLAGGVAHDFNNLLQVILGYSELIRDRSDLADETRRMLGKICDASSSARQLTQRLLAFSRRQVLRPVFLDLNDSVRKFLVLLGGLIGDDIELASVEAADLGTIEADAQQIEQVLMNLAINARDAMPKGGRIVFETSNVEIDETYAQQHLYIKPGPYVMLTVRDTGMGMDREIQSHAFEPFYTTKEAGRGTGLGLSTVFGIVRQSGGSIGIYSEPGQGTSFKIHFPRRHESPTLLSPPKRDSLRGGTETILLVDDADNLRGLTRHLLEQCGYTVLDAGDPIEALRLASEYEGPLPLMITDVVMPKFSGIVLADRLAVTRPEMKVLYTSGYADDAVARHGTLGPDTGFLEKPFIRADLIRKVRELLDLPSRTPVQPA